MIQFTQGNLLEADVDAVVNTGKSNSNDPRDSLFGHGNRHFFQIFSLWICRGNHRFHLARPRDWLLPMLMNGQVRVG